MFRSAFDELTIIARIVQNGKFSSNYSMTFSWGKKGLSKTPYMEQNYPNYKQCGRGKG